MNLLALETSTETLSLAVQHGRQRWEWEGPGGATSSRHLLARLLDLMQQAQLTMPQLNAVVWGQGPGSFTGLRTACAVAQGLAYPHGLPVLSVSSLLATAEQARQHYGYTQVMPVLDARMREVYVAAFHWESEQWTCSTPAHALAPSALVVAPPWQVAGNAHEIYRDQWQDAKAHVKAQPTASCLLDLAPQLLEQGLAERAQDVAPVYIRDRVALSTAERLAGMRL
jgi:tRNA threonylcarbamoyladenosine biosynthesis protein TsaB